MVSFQLVAALALGIAVVWLALVLAVVVRKHRRDLRESRSRSRRERHREALSSLDPEGLRALASDAGGSTEAQVDALAVLKAAGPPTARLRSALAAAGDATGLGPALLEQSRHRDPVKRGRAVLLMGCLWPAACVEASRRLLDDPDPDVRLAACAAAAAARTPAAAAALIGAIGNCKIPPARLVERLGERWAVDSLIAALAQPQTVEVRVALIRALGLSRDLRAGAAVLPYLLRGSAEERVSAARALGEVRAPRAFEGLCEALDDESWAVRAQASRALGRLGNPAAVDQLAAGLSDRAWWVRANAGSALRALGPAGLEALKRTRRRSPDRFARDRATEALAMTEMETIVSTRA